MLSWLRRESRRRARPSETATRALVYEVPEGRDPAGIVAALRKDGLEATEVLRPGRQRLVISGPRSGRRLRSQARAVIAREAGPKVTFADE